MNLKVLFVFIVALLWWNCMKAIKSVNFNSKTGEIPNTQFIARFSLPYKSSFRSTFKVKLRESYDISKSFYLSFLFFDDEDWNYAINSKSWEKSKSYAKYQHHMHLRGDGEWSRIESYDIPEISKNEVLYVLISDWLETTHQIDSNLPKVDVELHMLNSDSEFSHEEYGILTLNLILLFIYLYFLASNTYSLVIKAMSNDEVDYIKVGWIFAIYMELLHIGAQTIHLIVYSYNGLGFYILDVISTVLQMNSQIIVVGLLILIAYGWEITDADIYKDSKKYVIFGGIIWSLHTLMAYLTAFDDGEHHKYHDYSGMQGVGIIIIRICLYIAFINGVIKTHGKVPSKTQRFLKALSVAGTLYMLTFPALWLFSTVITAYLRNRLIVSTPSLHAYRCTGILAFSFSL